MLGHQHYYHLHLTVNIFFVHFYFSNETVFANNCDDWTNENVSFGARNYEYLFHSFVLKMKHFHWSNRHSCLGNCLV